MEIKQNDLRFVNGNLGFGKYSIQFIIFNVIYYKILQNNVSNVNS